MLTTPDVTNVVLELMIQSPDTGTSLESIAKPRYSEVLRRNIESSAALFGDKNGLISNIYDLFSEVKVENWDGMGASPLTPAALKNAERFIKALPTTLPLPEIAVEATGTFSFDWYISKYRYLSITVTENAKLLYVFSTGKSRSRGIIDFVGERPAELFELLDSFSAISNPKQQNV